MIYVFIKMKVWWKKDWNILKIGDFMEIDKYWTYMPHSIQELPGLLSRPKASILEVKTYYIG